MLITLQSAVGIRDVNLTTAYWHYVSALIYLYYTLQCDLIQIHMLNK